MANKKHGHILVHGKFCHHKSLVIMDQNAPFGLWESPEYFECVGMDRRGEQFTAVSPPLWTKLQSSPEELYVTKLSKIISNTRCPCKLKIYKWRWFEWASFVRITRGLVTGELHFICFNNLKDRIIKSSINSDIFGLDNVLVRWITIKMPNDTHRSHIESWHSIDPQAYCSE
jgi:hypothetical protein